MAWDAKRAEAEWLIGVLERAGYEVEPRMHNGRKVVGVKPKLYTDVFQMGVEVGREAGREAWMLGNFTMRSEIPPDGRGLVFPSMDWPERPAEEMSEAE